MNEIIEKTLDTVETEQNPVCEDKLYTRGELEKIVEQRLLRERRNNESFAQIREIIKNLRETGLFENLSNAAVAEKLAFLLQEQENSKINAQKQMSTEAAIPDAAEACAHSCMGADVGVAAENSERESDGAHELFEGKNGICGPAENGSEAENMNIIGELRSFIELYGEERLKSLMSDRAFRAFCVGKRGGICGLYESYTDFLSALGQSAEAKRYRAAQSVLASTGFSGGASTAADYGSLLTDNQRRIAAAAGMSYRQYAELLSQIPSKKPGNR